MERLRSHFLLSDLIGRRVSLKKHGREYTGLCPFHSEKTPSFTVNNEKGFFHCFGCAAHGDAIEFIKRHERLTYREAIERLAREAGIPIPAMSREAVEKEQAAQSQIGVLEAACRWFEKNLAASENASARDYLRERGLTLQTQHQFRIGYAPEAREGLKRYLAAEGYSEAQMIECGLIIRPDTGGTYDRFRSRITFPIRSARGQVIAFGGRLMGTHGKNLPKYLNSPETELFHKGEVLFNLDQAGPRARERDEMVIVEGYMDAISMVQAGITHTVATLGTAVTAEHLKKLWQYAPEPVLCLDGDAAGQRAMLRAAEMALPLLKPGYSLRFATLPAGEDPDSLIRSQGAEALKAVLSKARGISEILWLHFSAIAGKSAESLAALEHTLMGMASQIADATVKSHTRSYFKRQVWKQSATGEKGKRAPMARPRSVEVERLSAASAGALQLQPVRQLLKLILLQPSLLQTHEAEEYVANMDCINPALDALRQAMLRAVAEAQAEDAAQLYTFLDELGFTHAMSSLLNDKNIPVPSKAIESPAAARATWNSAVEAGRLALLEAEIRQLEPLDDAALARRQELQAQRKLLIEKRKASKDKPGDD